MDELPFHVRALAPRDQPWVMDRVREWGADYVISRGRVIHAAELPGFAAVGEDGRPLGMASYQLNGDQCELVTLQAFKRQAGIGTALLAAVKDAAAGAGCRRLWLVTTNDNLDALRFYQRRGLELIAVHKGLRETARLLKPSLPLIGEYEIPIRDEIELEIRLD